MHPDYARIYAAVQRIPRGRVATYGQIAALADLPRRARQVGYALHALPPGSPVPWQRVVNARGEVSLPGLAGARQRELLAAEGVEVGASGRIDLKAFQWRPRVAPAAPARPNVRPAITPGKAAARAPRPSSRRSARS